MPHGLPALLRHKSKALGYVVLSGRFHYFRGLWPAGQRKAPTAVRLQYDELIARWLAAGRTLPDEPVADTVVSVAEVLLAYVRYFEAKHAGKKRTPSCVYGMRQVVRIVRTKFGLLPAVEFGPRALKVVRDAMIERGWVRGVVNSRVDIVKKMFRWAASEELVPANTATALATVSGLRRGDRLDLPEGPGRDLVCSEVVDATLPLLPPPVSALVQLLRATGARPSELVGLRPCDLDRTDSIWVLRREKHKTSHRGKGPRMIFFGPQAQKVLEPWLNRCPDAAAPIFSPARFESERCTARGVARQTPRYPSHMKRNATKRKAVRKRAPRESYSPGSLQQAVMRACEKSNGAIQPWTIYQLRHLAGTRVREAVGLDAARAVLGHSAVAMTEVYSKAADETLARDAASKAG